MIIKNKQELNALRECGSRLARILHELSLLVKVGSTTQELEDAARCLAKEHEATPVFLGYKPRDARRPYPAALCVSVNDEIVHGIPNESPRTLKDGDIVTLDMGLLYDGHITDAAISMSVGSDTPENKTLLDAAREALIAGVRAARAGAYTGDIGHSIQEVGKRYGVQSPYELGGHGVGKTVHEDPFIPNFGVPHTGDRLVEGMVIAIEPIFTIGSPRTKLDTDGYTYKTKDGKKAVHIEHTVVITKGEAEILTQFQ